MLEMPKWLHLGLSWLELDSGRYTLGTSTPPGPSPRLILIRTTISLFPEPFQAKEVNLSGQEDIGVPAQGCPAVPGSEGRTEGDRTLSSLREQLEGTSLMS